MSSSDDVLKILIEFGLSDEAARTAVRDIEELKSQTKQTSAVEQERSAILDKNIDALRQTHQQVSRGADEVEKWNLHGREMHKLFQQLNKVIPGAGEALKAAFASGPMVGVIALVGVLQLVHEHFAEIKRKAAEAEQAATEAFMTLVESAQAADAQIDQTKRTATDFWARMKQADQDQAGKTAFDLLIERIHLAHEATVKLLDLQKKPREAADLKAGQEELRAREQRISELSKLIDEKSSQLRDIESEGTSKDAEYWVQQLEFVNRRIQQVSEDFEAKKIFTKYEGATPEQTEMFRQADFNKLLAQLEGERKGLEEIVNNPLKRMEELRSGITSAVTERRQLEGQTQSLAQKVEFQAVTDKRIGFSKLVEDVSQIESAAQHGQRLSAEDQQKVAQLVGLLNQMHINAAAMLQAMGKAAANEELHARQIAELDRRFEALARQNYRMGQ